MVVEPPLDHVLFNEDPSMRKPRLALLVLICCAFLLPAALQAAGPVADFQPDPKSVQRHGPAYRYPQAGWIVLHIEGEPYDRGYQHGKLLAQEIAGFVRCFAAQQSPKAPADGWRLTRSLVNSLFVRRYEKEYLEEMRGIADGATAAGAKYEGRPIDLVDVIALNSWAEIETLDSALEATPTGLEGSRFPQQELRAKPEPKPMHCSAFAATGPATADGKIVFGHITMFGLYASNFYNVWLDVQPAKGHRVLMQTYPAGIQSGMDYYMNDAGILVCETTIAQTKFDVKGMALASRIRQALQYSDTIDQAVEILQNGNNGLYTNEWLLGDTKTNEIAMFELGTHKSKLWRSSKNEWVGGTEGFYWGCNNTKDLEVRLETLAGVNERPTNVVFHPSDRDKVWIQLFNKYRGKMDADFGKVAFTTPPLAAIHSLDAKFTTTEMARDLKTWALFGPPLGRTWQPSDDEKQKYPEIRPLVSNPWVVLHSQAPAKPEHEVAVVDLGGRKTAPETTERPEGETPVQSGPAWHGTLLPKSDADIWLTSAFADYERVYSGDRPQRRRANPEQRRGSAGAERLGLDLYGFRSGYLAALRSGGDDILPNPSATAKQPTADVPLSKTASNFAKDEWYRIANGKGVLVLHELRQLLGDKAFEETMDSFGRAHAGKEVTTAEFQAHVEKAGGDKLKGFFDYWINKGGLPVLTLAKPKLVEPPPAAGSDKPAPFRVEGEIRRNEGLPRSSVSVTVETADGETTKPVSLEGAVTSFTVEVEKRPLRVVVDKYGTTARAGPGVRGGVYSLGSFFRELERCLIVYGTGDEVAANREAAEALQSAIIRRGPNITVPIKTDREVTDKDLANNHLLLIGRPDCNLVVERCRGELPLSFGSKSFVAGNESYANADSAVLAVMENPNNPRYSAVVVAGLSSAATLRAAPGLVTEMRRPAEVVALVRGGRPKEMLVPARELVHEFAER
jgi:hypothetical protein